MPITTISSRELNQDVTRAKKAAVKGPVFITERGKLTHVLLAVEEYQLLTKQRRTLAEALAMPEGGENLEFEPPKINIAIKPAEFS